jgi:glycosyltransferase involved in cell wall biosynthesis
MVAAGDFHLAQSLRQYDRVVYCMGNSQFHGHVLELLRERPGIVVLHDVRLTGFYGWFAGQERPEDPTAWLAERIRANYGSRLGLELVDGRAPNWAEQHALGLYMTGEIQALAEAVFVHSSFARDLLALDGGLLARTAPVRLLPFGMPPATERPRHAPSGTPLIISLGVVHELKGIAELIRGFALFAADFPTARLVIAGPTDACERERWIAYARELAPTADIQITGHVSAASYNALIEAADVAVQLRLVSNGEASATVADCLSAGLPTLVSDLGWARELPDGAVARLRVGATPLDIAGHLKRLVTDLPLRASLSAAGLDHVRANSFGDVALAYVAALELD